MSSFSPLEHRESFQSLRASLSGPQHYQGYPNVEGIGTSCHVISCIPSSKEHIKLMSEHSLIESVLVGRGVSYRLEIKSDPKLHLQRSSYILNYTSSKGFMEKLQMHPGRQPYKWLCLA